jgi:hypothetical protein
MDKMTSRCERYDIRKNKWYEWLPMGHPRAGAAAFIVDHSIYILGGKEQSVEMIKLNAIKPTTTDDSLQSQRPPGGAPIPVDNPHPENNMVDAHDEETKRWSVCRELKLPAGVFGHVAAPIDDKKIVVVSSHGTWIMDITHWSSSSSISSSPASSSLPSPSSSETVNVVSSSSITAAVPSAALAQSSNTSGVNASNGWITTLGPPGGYGHERFDPQFVVL